MDHSQGMTQNYSDPHTILNGIDEFAHPFGQNGDFDLSTWDGQLYGNTAENPTTFGQGQSTSTWHQNTMDQPGQQIPQTHPQSQPSFQTNNFQQQQNQFEARPPSQAAFDPRSISQRPSPSPVQFQGYPYQQNFQYPLNSYGQHQGYNQHLQQPVNAPQGQNRPPSFSPPPPPQSPYMQYPIQQQRQHQAQNLPSVYQTNFSTFPVQQQQRSASTFVDPTLLSASNFQNVHPEHFQQGFSQIQRQALSSSPALGQQQRQHTPASINDKLPVIIQQQDQPIVISDVSGPDADFSRLEKVAIKTTKKKDPNAPKRPRGRPRKDGLPPRQKVPGAASPAETDSDDLEVEDAPEERPAILSSIPAAEPEQKAIWDTVQAVWSPRNKPATLEKVRHGIALYGELVKRLRDEWKAQNEALKKAELSNAPTDELKRKVMQWRNVLQTVMQTTLEKGHPAHITKLGENHWTIIALREFLIDRILATDWDGSLVLSILRVMAHFTTLDQEMLEKTKMEKALTRFAKKSGQEIKDLVQRVLDSAAAATKRKVDRIASPEPSGTEKATRPLSGDARNSPQLAGIKRPREESATQPATKKLVTPKAIPEASKPLALQNALKKSEAAARAVKTESGVNSNTTAATKPKSATTQSAAVKPPMPSVFSSLMSASKKPGTSNAARAAAAAAAADKAAAPAPSIGAKTESPPPAPTSASAPPAPKSAPSFSFSQTFAGLNRPKEAEEKIIDDKPEETEEDRIKRLKKEARRKLRVTWKPDDTLTEVRVFSHHPDEELGHADNMVRDVNDVGGEGRMLKMHKDLDDIDDDEEAKAAGEDLSPYCTPSAIDLEGVEEEQVKNNFYKRGGDRQADSPERTAQDQREQTSLMVVYALPSDVPPSPKEPPAASEDEEYSPPTPIGEPTTPFVREREQKYYAAVQPSQPTIPQNNLSAIFAALGQQNQQQVAQPPLDLEGTLGLFPHMQQPQQSQQQPPTNPAGGLDLAKLISVVQQTQQQAQPPPPQPTIAAAPAGNDLTALLASLQSSTAQVPQQQQAQSALPFNLTNLFPPNATQQPTSFNAYSADQYSRKHGRDDYDPYDERRKKTKNQEVSDQKKRHPKEKTVVCRFWKEGKCKKGDDCTYIHD